MMEWNRTSIWFLFLGLIFDSSTILWDDDPQWVRDPWNHQPDFFRGHGDDSPSMLWCISKGNLLQWGSHFCAFLLVTSHDILIVPSENPYFWRAGRDFPVVFQRNHGGPQAPRFLGRPNDPDQGGVMHMNKNKGLEWRRRNMFDFPFSWE